MRARKVLAVCVFLVGVVTTFGLAYLFQDVGVVAQGDAKPANVASPATEVGGIIDSNTTWTQANSPYSLTSDVQIAAGVKLTIQPGVVVNGDYLRRIDVFGSLLVMGTADDNVVFDNVSFGCNQEGVIDIRYSRINAGGIGVGRCSIHLQDSYLQDLSELSCSSLCNVLIERNIFIRDWSIFLITTANSQVVIRNNAFKDQPGYAIYQYSNVGPSPVLVEFNSFLSTDREAISGESGTDIDARNNYWNTTNPAVIESMIFDKNDNPDRAFSVLYKPFLTAPHPDTPHDLFTPTPTLTPIPTSTETPTPDLIATLTAVNNHLATAVAATLTAVAPQPNQLYLPNLGH